MQNGISGSLYVNIYSLDRNRCHNMWDENVPRNEYEFDCIIKFLHYLMLSEYVCKNTIVFHIYYLILNIVWNSFDKIHKIRFHYEQYLKFCLVTFMLKKVFVINYNAFDEKIFTSGSCQQILILCRIAMFACMAGPNRNVNFLT